MLARMLANSENNTKACLCNTEQNKLILLEKTNASILHRVFLDSQDLRKVLRFLLQPFEAFRPVIVLSLVVIAVVLGDELRHV